MLLPTWKMLEMVIASHIPFFVEQALEEGEQIVLLISRLEHIFITRAQAVDWIDNAVITSLTACLYELCMRVFLLQFSLFVPKLTYQWNLVMFSQAMTCHNMSASTVSILARRLAPIERVPSTSAR